MAYHTVAYLGLFLVLTYFIWCCVPAKFRPFVLLAASWAFILIGSRQYIVYILLDSAVIWIAGLVLEKLARVQHAAKDKLEKLERKALNADVTALKKGVVAIAVILLLAVLLHLKYASFLAEAANTLLIKVPFFVPLVVTQGAVPLGLSFYSLMAISYVVDVYRGTCPAARHFWQASLFLSFWPHMVEGPFDRYGAQAQTLLNGDAQRPNYENLTRGLQLLLWGLFKKMVVADRANMLVSAVFDNHQEYSGIAVVFATLLYTLQLYADFSGCIDIATGSAQLFGIPIAQNFRQPFFSRSVGEFWRRWHITLGAFLREYVFQPFVMSKLTNAIGKKCKQVFGATAGRNIPVFMGLGVVWLLMGLWHGAGWGFIFYGFYYFALQLMGQWCEPLLIRVCPHIVQWRETLLYRGFQMARTFVLVNIGMLLFRANGLMAAFSMLRSTTTAYTDTLLIRLATADIILLFLGAAVMLVVDILHEKGVSLRQNLAARPVAARWGIYVAAVLAIIVFGAYGQGYDTAAFIYAQF